MHPILLIILLWFCVGVVSLVTALGIKVLLPGVGPFVAAMVGLVFGVGGVFSIFVTSADERVRNRIQSSAGGPDVEDTIDRYYEESSRDSRTDGE